MEQMKPMHITCEDDLQVYEDYLQENFSEKSLIHVGNKTANHKGYISQVLNNNIFSSGYLRKNIGKLLKVESLIGNSLDVRIGKLTDVGADYIALKLNKSCCSLMIPTSSIRYITIIHDNDFSKMLT